MGMYECRAPHGARGLKQSYETPIAVYDRSRPARGAWIETRRKWKMKVIVRSRPARGAWIETYY